MSGVEWMVDVYGCRSPCCSSPRWSSSCSSDHRPHAVDPIGRPIWHQFPGTHGLTAVWMLQESHLTIHTFPEFGSANLNLFCCSTRRGPTGRRLVRDPLSGSGLRVQECSRTYGDADPVSPGRPA